MEVSQLKYWQTQMGQLYVVLRIFEKASQPPPSLPTTAPMPMTQATNVEANRLCAMAESIEH